MGSNGGVANTIANSVNGIPLLFLDAIDIDPQTETVYFTDAGSIFQKRFITHMLLLFPIKLMMLYIH